MRRIKKYSLRHILDYGAIVVLLLVILLPFVYVFVSSFKPLKEIMTARPAIFPHEPTFRNYATLFLARTPIRDFLLFLYNSFKVAIGTSLLSVVISSIAGYGLARHRYPGRDTLARMMLFMYVFPTIMLLIPIYKIFSSMGMLDTHLSLIIVYTALTAPFCTWLLISFFEGIPIALEEAAAVDGASKPLIFLRITLPLSAPGILTAGVYAFIIAWGEYMFALVLLMTSSKRTGPLGLATFTAEQYIEWGPLLAGSILISLPIIILFFPLAKFFIKGFMAGAIKE
ncbi:MAG: carbohydrate ABC transporter permease [Candidatus Atribacteria bacterium]|jgi:ABC-type glycerol-3-phosphate transport system permease component|nr:carbohydrate ABC transporter permease [Candidatus Atribacteria bacterium]